jgi:hypothetical protein
VWPEARDLRRCKLAGNFFNVLFNLNKFIAFEAGAWTRPLLS